MAKDFNKDLVSTMKGNPKLKSVWINKSGEWLFHETKGYDEYTRKDVTGSEFVPAKQKPYGKMNIEELKAVCVEKQIPEEDYINLKGAEIVALLKAKDAEPE